MTNAIRVVALLALVSLMAMVATVAVASADIVVSADNVSAPAFTEMGPWGRRKPGCFSAGMNPTP